MPTKVVNLRKEEYTVYIGRAGRGHDGYYGNPVAVNRRCPECGLVHRGGGDTLDCYKKYLVRRLKTDAVFRQRVQDLEGETLACFCKPAKCHGDVLVWAIEQMNKGLL